MECMRDDFKRGQILDGRFTTVAPLNHGSFGMVFSAKDTMSGDDVAIKCITKPGVVDESTSCPAAIATDDRSEELVIHSRLDYHPNIVNLIDHFETKAHQYMVLELCSNGDLYEAIRAGHGPLETEHVRAFMLELVQAVDYLHSHGVFHRDIKPENIFLTASGVMKLGDFGLATTDTWSTEFAVGSDRYMSPEQFDSSVYGYGYSPASADIWAIGIVLLNVLFQRNPFASPTPQDPLFADFARDRQSLFDVFPNMSNDTFNVLVHSLALDPANRSLGAVREALKAAVSFTTDDESLDEFCTEHANTELVPTATAAREPLRTPSITSPNMSSADSYPWGTTDALLKTPPKYTRQLSTIPDIEPELFPGSAQSDWQYVDDAPDADEASLSSNIDSGLGMSYKSSKSIKSAKSGVASAAVAAAAGVAEKPSVSFVGSLPISFTRPSKKSTSSPYGANGSGFSKSWSDLWDEEEEGLELEEEEEHQDEHGDASQDVLGLGINSIVKPSTPQLGGGNGSEDGRGSVTPRPRRPEVDDVIADRAASPLRKLIEHDRANPQTPKQRSASILDKWSALGNFRRAKQPDVSSSSASASGSTSASVTPTATATPTPQKMNAFASFTSFGSAARKQKSASKLRESSTGNGTSNNNNGNGNTTTMTATTSSWRQGSPVRLRSTSMNSSRIWERKDAAASATALAGSSAKDNHSPTSSSSSSGPPDSQLQQQSQPQPQRHSQEHAWSRDNNWREHKPPVAAAAAGGGGGGVSNANVEIPQAPSTPSRIPASQAEHLAASLPASLLLSSGHHGARPSTSSAAGLRSQVSSAFLRGFGPALPGVNDNSGSGFLGMNGNKNKSPNFNGGYKSTMNFFEPVGGSSPATGLMGGGDDIGDLEWVGGGWHDGDDDY